MFCYKCGVQNQDGANYCINCGTIIGSVVLPPPPVGGSLADDQSMRFLLPVGRSGLAIAAGYLGLFSVTLVLAPVAALVSVLAIRDLKSNPKKMGMGRAIFGLVMGILGSVALAIVIASSAWTYICWT